MDQQTPVTEPETPTFTVSRIRTARWFRGLSLFLATTILYSSAAAGVNSIFTALHTTLMLQGGGDYTDTPGTLPTLMNPVVQPINRGNFYSADDLSILDHASQIEAELVTGPTIPDLIDPLEPDPGDNGALDGRPEPTSLSIGYPGEGGTSGSTGTTGTTGTTTGTNGFTTGGWVTTGATNGTTGSSTTSTTGFTNGGGETGSTTSFTSTGRTATTTGGSTTTGGTTGSTTGTTTGSTTGSAPPPGSGGGPAAGTAFPWEGSKPAGGSEFAPATVNTQTGNRLTTMPVVGWKAKGGLPIELTLYHNSQDNVDIGWGKNWRSNLDFRCVYTGKYLVNETVTVTYPTGRKLIFKREKGPGPNPHISNRFFPPAGFYDIMYFSGTPNGPVQGYTLRTQDQFTYTFDAQGKLTSFRDRHNNAANISRTYVSGGFETKLTDSNGRFIKYLAPLNSSTGKYSVTEITAPGSRVWNLTHQSVTPTPGSTMGAYTFLQKFKYPTLNTASNTRPESQFLYSMAGAIVRETDPTGREWNQTYTNGKLTKFTLPETYLNMYAQPVGIEYNLVYNAANTEYIHPDGHKVTEYYDTGLLAQVKDEAGFHTQYSYDNWYNVRSERDELGNISYFDYDSFGNTTKVQDARMKLTNAYQSYTYNAWNDVLTETDTRGAVTLYVRNPSTGTITSVKNGLNQTVGTYTYNGDGTIDSAASAGATTTFTYDILGQIDGLITPDGSATVAYGTGVTIGKPISVTDSQNRTSTLSYDSWGRLTSTTRHDNVTASVAMNVLGWITSATDVLNRQTTMTRDGIGRVKTVTNARGDVETLGYDSRSRQVSVKNGRNYTRTYGYTPRSELKQITFADGTTEGYKYDATGSQTRKINGMGQSTSYTYDASSNLTGISYQTGGSTSFEYDLDGRQTKMTDATGVHTWTYDNADNLTKLVTPQGVMDYAYDQWGRRFTLTEGSAVTTYTYTNHRLTRIHKPADSVDTMFYYDSYGRITQKTDGDTKTLYGYDGNDRLYTLDHKKNSTNAVFHSETYNYDYANNLSTKLVNSVLSTYTYDNIDQLLSESRSGYYCGYTYDANGNRATKTLNSSVETYAYDPADKLSTRSGTNGTFNYTYDDNGRTTQISGPSGTRTFTWNEDDRLTNLTGGGTPSTNYTYNGIGARVGKSNTNGSRTYKRDGTYVDSDVLSDSISSMVPGISERVSGTTKMVHKDHLGSTKALTSAGIVTDTIEYDAFGSIVNRTGTTNTQKGFGGGHGYQEDSESGYKLLGYRYYDPATGRFLTRDPIMDGRNHYVYCNNNPLKAVDASGLSAGELEGPIGRGEANGHLPKGTLDKYKKDADFRRRYHEKLGKAKKKKGPSKSRDKKGRTDNQNLSDDEIWQIGKDLLSRPVLEGDPDFIGPPRPSQSRVRGGREVDSSTSSGSIPVPSGIGGREVLTVVLVVVVVAGIIIFAPELAPVVVPIAGRMVPGT